MVPDDRDIVSLHHWVWCVVLCYQHLDKQWEELETEAKNEDDEIETKDINIETIKEKIGTV